MFDIPRECFKYGSASEQIQAEGGEHYKISGVSFEGSIHLIVEGAQFPYESFVPNTTLYATNQLKSVLIEGLKLMSKPQNLIGSLITFLTSKQEMVWVFNRLGHRMVGQYVLKDNHLSVFAREFQYGVFEFIRHFVTEEAADKFSELLTHMIEHDDAYKLRIKDVMLETTKEKLNSPRELVRLAEIMQVRSGSHQWTGKIVSIARLIRLLTLIPNVKKAYKSVVKNINLSNLQGKNNDLYWSVFKKDYDYMGIGQEKRKEICLSKGWVFPEALK